MATKLLPTINTIDNASNMMQANVTNALNQIQQTPFFGGNTKTATITAGAPSVIAHGLGRQPVLWIVFDKNANANVWRSSWDSSHITLNASVTCTITFWVN